MDEKFVERVTAGEIFGKSIEVYKKGFKVLVSLYMFITLVGFIQSVCEVYLPMIGINPQGILVRLVFIVINLIVTCRIMVAFITAVEFLFKDKEIGFGESFTLSQGFAGNYFGVLFLYGLMVGVPAFVMILISTFSGNIIFAYLVLIALVVWMVYVGLNYGLGAIIVVTDPQYSSFFERSKYILSGNRGTFVTIFLAQIGLGLLISLDIIIRTLSNLGNQFYVYHETLFSISYSTILTFFIMPFSAILTIMCCLEFARVHDEADKDLIDDFDDTPSGSTGIDLEKRSYDDID